MSAPWTYGEAFCRNLGLISPVEQALIRQARIAIPGMGGVGGSHLITLVRQGFERFTIADFDTFEVHNFNRQYGAELASIGKKKTEWMVEKAKAINPNVDFRVFNEPIVEGNVDNFMKDADLVIDGIDAFEVRARRIIFSKAHERGIHVVTAGPMGFSVVWLIFSPKGMTSDQFFGFHDQMSDFDITVNFLTGLNIKATQLKYMDTSYVNFNKGTGPSSALSCQLCSAVAAAEAIRIILQRPGLKPAPHIRQFDAYRGILKGGTVWFGARNPMFIIRRMIVERVLRKAIQALPE